MLRQIFLAYVGPITASLTIIGNIIEIYTIFESRKHKQLAVSMMFFLNLSISHLITGIASLLYHTLQAYTNALTGLHTDLLTGFFLRCSLYINALNLVMLTLIRMYAVTRPITYRNVTRKYARRTCFTTWGLALLLSSLCFIIHKYDHAGYDRYAQLIFPIITISTVVLCSVAFYRINKTLHNQGKFRVKHLTHFNGKTKKRTIGALVSAISTTDTLQNNRKNMRLRYNTLFEINLIKLTGSTIVLFILCWFPIATYSILEAVKVTRTPSAKLVLLEIALVNSLLNPVFYFIHMRSQIKKQIRHRFTKISNGIKKPVVEDLQKTQPETANGLVKVAVVPIFDRYNKSRYQ